MHIGKSNRSFFIRFSISRDEWRCRVTTNLPLTRKYRTFLFPHFGHNYFLYQIVTLYGTKTTNRTKKTRPTNDLAQKKETYTICEITLRRSLLVHAIFQMFNYVWNIWIKQISAYDVRIKLHRCNWTMQRLYQRTWYGEKPKLKLYEK